MTTIAMKQRARLLQKIAAVIRNGIKAINNLFSLEEVEVTFTKVGGSTRYSYTKIDHKRAA